jgi:ABC-type proline/glycine betaine transport system ATPase subunit
MPMWASRLYRSSNYYGAVIDIDDEEQALQPKIDSTGFDRRLHERVVVSQKHALMPWMNVVRNVAFGLRLRKMPLHERPPIGMECLRKIGLADSAHKPVYDLSGGMQQRVGVARAMRPRTAGRARRFHARIYSGVVPGLV